MISEFVHDAGLDLFQPPVWLRNPHAQTVLNALFGKVPKLPFRRERIETHDGDFVDLDWIDGEPDLPIVLACHGLEGCSRAKYMVRLMKCVRDAGWSGVSMNFRGCSGEPNRLLRAYHSGETGDIQFVIEHIVKRKPDAALYVVGHSLGGNVICKWLGEPSESVHDQIRGACVCSVPYHLQACQQKMDRGIRRVYVEYFLRSLRRKMKQKEIMFPGELDYKRIHSSYTFKAFDDLYTATAHGFDGYVDYYARSSSYPYLEGIRVPALLIHALDDPFTPVDSLPNRSDISNEYLHYFYQTHGGHLGFYDQHYQTNWLPIQVMKWLQYLNQT